MNVTIVIRRPDDREDEIKGDAVEVTKGGSLLIFNTEISAKTTTTKTRFMFWSSEETETNIEKKRYTSAIYPHGKWIAAYSKVTRKLPAPPEAE